LVMRRRFRMELKFYRCEHCGNIIAKVNDSGVPVICCGEEMQELIPGTTDGAAEKHVPVYETLDGKAIVTVGSVMHPSTDDHYIEWIAIQTNQGNQRKCLKPQENPIACFALCEGEKIEAVYEYCNLHGLWKAE